MNPSRLLAELRDAVGAAHVLVDGDLSAYELDWRRRRRGKALAVVQPGSTEQVAATVRACAAHGAAVVAQGGNTGLVGGGVPDASGQQVLLSLKRLQRVREIDTANATITLEAGCVLKAAQEAAAQQGLLLALSLAAEGSCTIGGNLATNAGGTQVLRFGTAREQCLGLEVVTARGEVWHGLSGLRKDNTGYDLRDLMIGSEGTLGIITAATMKLHPLPAAQLAAWVACRDLNGCAALLRLARQHLDAALTGFEVIGAAALELVARHFPQLPQPLPGAPWAVLLECSDTQDQHQAQARLEALLQAALLDGCSTDAALAHSHAQARALWQVRESISLAQALEGPNIKHDIALPVSQVTRFVERTDAALQAALPGCRVVVFGHLGDGNLHYNVQAPADAPAPAFIDAHEPAVNRLVYDAVAAHGGSISAEHGIGALRRDELAQRKSPVALAMMRAIKQALDPHGTLNPGRVL